MYLKRLEITGFKSFADRTELEFVPGITAVVGPNGSGKSNISDAIRWVLGEQSAKSLRGAKMEDIIFSGSDSRKPLNFCEVSLTLDNTDQQLKIDFSEITVTRRVYRSGESEYYINRQSCRLRDIVELFMDTGVGKEAYSVIGQGRIEEILSTRSEDRRGLFEEAAGIVKYKARKKEAVKKLDETEQNLVRVQDIMKELEEQIQPLAKQAEKARAYLSLKETLAQHEIGLYVKQFDLLYAEWEEAKARIDKLVGEQVECAASINRMDAQTADLRAFVGEQDQVLEELQQRLLMVTEEVEKKEGVREVLRERLRNYSKNKQDARNKAFALTEKQDALRDQIAVAKQQLEAAGKEVTALEKELALEQRRYMNFAAFSDGDVERLKADYFEILNQMASMRNEIRHWQQSIEANKQKWERLEASNRQLIDQKESLNARREELEQELADISARLAASIEAFKKEAAAQKERTDRKSHWLEALREGEHKLNALLSRRDTMKEMQADFSGFMQGVREILKARQQGFKGIEGAVAELISTDKQYETAIEVALGGALQHVVVTDEAVGRQAIALLKNRRAGRATFLPLDVIRPRQLPAAERTRVMEMDGVIGVAAELVSCAERYEHIVYNLLGNVVVTKTLEQANAVARTLGYRYRVVTLEGDVVNPGGSMSGGAIQQKSNHLLGRQRQLEQLEEEIVRQKRINEELYARLEAAKADEEAWMQKQEQIRAEGERLRLREQEIKGLLRELEASEKNIAERWEFFQQDQALLEKEYKQAKHRIAVLEEELEEMAIAEQEKQQEIEAAERNKKEKETNKETLSARITELKVQVATRKEQYEARLSEYNRLEKEYKEVSTELEATSKTLLLLDSDSATSDEEEERLEREIRALRTEKEQYSMHIQEQRKKRQEVQAQLAEQEAEIKEKRRQLKEIEENLHKHEVKVERMDVELDNLLQKLREEYELSYEMAKAKYPLPDDVGEAAKLVNSIKQQIAALGTVNLGSIQEYERLRERQEFLLLQHRDLSEAKATLYQVIADIEAEMSRRFKETFEAIREQFQLVFTQLFGGGRADLQLSDPDNLLETGIEIVAQPPGKKLQYLALLSGGEKALTAIALLFSILRVKPVPFCVLDEVEAALDEANVTRFAQYLREFCEKTQFIVVTHRRGTMEGADVLYGVTMQESGVSKLVSVRLEDETMVS
ncbi:chromosome segregation protein SMC [Aneurinibacillus thermoaerophilus]|uniref:Chromosome partition protein Smc n=1 Tax=Aneurinibacillus thermoaerophilus TaxID=143495 RepID=A0A1G7WET3_ANETH|nr:MULTISPECIES: chromosome segregation protein SMC [Aneurinibacillus]AMA72638.1 chromosome segregation protein SMC [Aneurinibacillus sp. XH2]MED0674647.1 chromosome segregation protein SMC [Aneurinibacillus thermoaerophilus]MED0680130.1 chromosome segregation protein SMC [Aneurinibacillus thermoaerophilus]MED0756762.1 chromosome segregation protein SMC [Aneurinibacillus thermoaerophilus]MED0760812.1 chromosome segregation protein SMC [Aneurinibacillus thermoaerophilus]